MIELEYWEDTDTYDATTHIYAFGLSRREALLDMRDKLEQLTIECDEKLAKEKEDENEF